MHSWWIVLTVEPWRCLNEQPCSCSVLQGSRETKTLVDYKNCTQSPKRYKNRSVTIINTHLCRYNCNYYRLLRHYRSYLFTITKVWPATAFCEFSTVCFCFALWWIVGWAAAIGCCCGLLAINVMVCCLCRLLLSGIIWKVKQTWSAA